MSIMSSHMPPCGALPAQQVLECSTPCMQLRGAILVQSSAMVWFDVVSFTVCPQFRSSALIVEDDFLNFRGKFAYALEVRP